VVADAFITVYDHIGRFDSNRPFMPWFYRIVVNGATKAIRKASRRGTGSGVVQKVLEQQPDTEPGPEEKVLLGERRNILDAAVQTLPPKQRAAIVLRYYLQMGESEIAQALGCPPGTVKWRLHTARMKLRRVLAKSPDPFPFEDL
jgi:RNA polymerase sigma-70 factor (ECF subfamily)